MTCLCCVTRLFLGAIHSRPPHALGPHPTHAYADAYRLLPLSRLPYRKNRMGNLRYHALATPPYPRPRDALTAPWPVPEMQVRSLPTGSRDLAQISDRSFINTPPFQTLTVVHLHTKQREGRSKVRPREAVGRKCRCSIYRVLFGEVINPSSSLVRCRYCNLRPQQET